jgi:hypothetical protein
MEASIQLEALVARRPLPRRNLPRYTNFRLCFAKRFAKRVKINRDTELLGAPVSHSKQSTSQKSIATFHGSSASHFPFSIFHFPNPTATRTDERAACPPICQFSESDSFQTGRSRLSGNFRRAPRQAPLLVRAFIQYAFSRKRQQISSFRAATPSTFVPKLAPINVAFVLLVLRGVRRTLNGHSRGRCPVATKERRATRRFLMRLPLTVRWTDETVVGEAATESREVSSRGLYFHLPKGLKSGSPVEIVMTLPHELTQAGPVRVRCLGRILRSSAEHSGEVGVAAAIERYEFMRNGENAA